MRDITLEDTFYQLFTTRAFATGIPTVLAGSPVVSAYENEGLMQITAGITLGVDHDGVVGLNLLTVVGTAANGYENGKDYGLVITTGTVASVSVVGEIVAEFTIGRSAAAVDLANGTDGLGAIKTDTAATLVDTGEIGTAGVGLTNIGTIATVTTLTNLPAITADWLTAAGTAADFTTEIQTGLATPTNITAATGIVLSAVTHTGAVIPTVSVLTGHTAQTADHTAGIAALPLLNEILDETLTGHVTADSVAVALKDILADTNELQVDDVPTLISTLDAVVDTVKAETVLILADTGTTLDGKINTIGVDTAATQVLAAGATGFAAIDTVVDSILVDTAEIGAAGAGLTDLGGMSTTMKAQVNTEVVDVVNVDTLVLPGQAAPSNTPTMRETLGWLYKNFRNRKSQTATTWSLYADNETTVDNKATVSDDATTAIKQEVVTGP